MNWGDLIRGLLGGIFDIIKGLWGTDKPSKDTINDVPPTTPKPPPDDQLLADLGLHAGTNDRDALRPDQPRNAVGDPGQRDGEGPSAH